VSATNNTRNKRDETKALFIGFSWKVMVSV
jgi:hypothetical protein